MTREEAIKALSDFPHCETCGAMPDCSKCREALDMAIEALKEQPPKWTPAKERLPEIKEGHEYYGTRCIICDNYKQVFTLRYCKHIVRKKEIYRWVREDMTIYYGEVVCWMPFPEPPKDGEQN